MSPQSHISSPPTPPPPPPIHRPYINEHSLINNESILQSNSPDRSTPSTCDTSSSNGDSSFLLQPYSSVVNFGPTNTSIDLNHDDDDQFYDTCSNADSTNESEISNFKFLEECTRDRIQELRELIFEQVSSNELNEFVATVILLGTKFQSINTFLKFLGVVEDALEREGSDAYSHFKRYLELKIPTFYDLLVSKFVNFFLEYFFTSYNYF